MPQPPPRKVKPSAQLKTLHTEQLSKLQAKHQQECDLLEDIRTFSRQRSVLEKEYAQGLLKLTGQLLKRDFQAMPDLSTEDGREHRTAMAVWRVILEETDVLAKKRLQAAETYLEKIAEPIKPLKTNKQQCMKKVLPQMTTIQGEVGQTIIEMCKTQKTYNIDETQAYDARAKAKDAEEKLNRKSKGIFQSLASLQKNYAKLKTRMESCESKSVDSRNEYLLCMAAANAHQVRYFTTDLPHLMEVLDGEIFERIQEYFAIYGNTAQEISCYENRCCNRIVEQTAMINRNFDLKCFLYSNHVFTDLVQYEFDPCLQDKCNKISKDYSAAHHLDKEARKWATKIAKENKAIKEYQKALKAISSGDKVSDSGSSEAVSQDPEVKTEELLQNIRQSETARAKAEARIEALRQAGVNVDDWLSSANGESLGLDEEFDLPRTPSRTSIKTDSSGHTDDQEPTYTHYDEDDDFLDETFDVTVGDFSLKSNSSQYPIKCRSIYDFHAGNADELDMAENEELEIIANGDGDGWVRAKNSAGLIGFIPENYIVFVDDNNTTVQNVDAVDNNYIEGEVHNSVEEPDLSSPPPPMTPVTPTSPASIPTIEEPDDFPPPPPETQEVTSYSSGDIEVQQTTNSMDNMHLPLDDGCYVRALYDYEGASQEELSFAEGTIIKIVRKDENGIDDGFWEGEVNGIVGVFPSLVVEELASAGTPQDFPSPLQSPPDYMPPPPVMITAATPESEHPPSPLTPSTPIANGTVHGQTDENESVVVEQHRKKVRFGMKNYYNRNQVDSYHDDAFYNQHDIIVDEYDSRFDDDREESFV
ncbi:F-BAR and double SH3 domains protein 2-like isoform X2 [Mercenaria mercenaria]|uniref:F-BAR and double SH3 domains protein 2-like isoform X2 n=1 Tax=Mercenaria mercenaria TaxID=6596 RepID=UPI00234EF85E|nr:F-BAR and double SH3 domains protein 2-like isoform X2 [Mercenaria mercenaria]